MDKTTIIVVEDNIVYCEFVCNMLAREGYRTVKAYHRAEFHAFHGGINFGVVGHNDEGLHLSLLSHPAQKVNAVTVRQAQVGNHDVIICRLV